MTKVTVGEAVAPTAEEIAVNKVVLIGDITIGNVKQVLLDCLMWLDKDAAFAHPNSKVRQFKDNVTLTLQQVRNDEVRFLGKKFDVEPTNTEPQSVREPISQD